MFGTTTVIAFDLGLRGLVAELGVVLVFLLVVTGVRLPRFRLTGATECVPPILEVSLSEYASGAVGAVLFWVMLLRERGLELSYVRPLVMLVGDSGLGFLSSTFVSVRSMLTRSLGRGENPLFKSGRLLLGGFVVGTGPLSFTCGTSVRCLPCSRAPMYLPSAPRRRHSVACS